eukprot:PITA_04478
MGWEIHQMDVKTTFLNGVIEEELYIEQREGFETHEKKSHVCRLKKALYGLKQVSRAWYGRIDGYLQKIWFAKSDADPNLYYLFVENEPLVLVLYVDDLFLTKSSKLIEDCKKNLATEFDMKDLGQMHYFLGLMVTPMITIWNKIDASEDKDVDPTLYWQLIGSLMYLVNTIPDLLRYQHPQSVHDWVGSSVNRKSTFGYCFNIGSGMTSWCNRKQKSVALSSAEAKYMAASTASCESIWLRKLLVNLFRRRMEAIRIMCDNQSCIKLSENPVFQDRSKHIDIQCYFVKDCA